MNIAIVGSGPVAAYANAAVRDAGFQATIYGEPPKSGQRYGAFWPQYCPKGCTVPSSLIYVTYLGNRENYLEKQWGSYHTSWETSFEDDRPSRVPRTIYPEQPLYDELSKGGLWLGGSSVPSQWEDVKSLTDKYDLVFCSLRIMPEGVLGERWYESLITRGSNYIFTRKIIPADAPYPFMFEPQCFYDGRPIEESIVARCTIINGVISLEIPAGMLTGHAPDWLEHYELAAKVDDIPPWVSTPYKELERDGITPIGRWATLNRRDLSHSAYFAVEHRIRKVLGAKPVEDV